MKVVKPHSFGRNRIDVWRFDHGMPVAAQPIGPLLISDKEHKVRTLGH